MAYPKGRGKAPGSGRKKGSVNKVNADLRQMIAEALNNAGGIKYLESQAKASPAAFLKLVGQIVPKDVTIQGGAAPVIMQVITGVPNGNSGS